MIKEQMDKIYRDLERDKIPWNNESPPKVLTDLTENGIIKPCKAADLGCGTGNYTIYLASKGFQMTGFDISTEALSIAMQNAINKNVECNFISLDLTVKALPIKDKFDFVFDFEVLHHIFPEQRKNYISNVNSLLEAGGKYMSVCFSENDKAFGGTGKYRKTPLGTELYFSSIDELEELYKPYFRISELKTTDIIGRTTIHNACYAFLEKL